MAKRNTRFYWERIPPPEIGIPRPKPKSKPSTVVHNHSYRDALKVEAPKPATRADTNDEKNKHVKEQATSDAIDLGKIDQKSKEPENLNQLIRKINITDKENIKSSCSLPINSSDVENRWYFNKPKVAPNLIEEAPNESGLNNSIPDEIAAILKNTSKLGQDEVDEYLANLKNLNSINHISKLLVYCKIAGIEDPVFECFPTASKGSICYGCRLEVCEFLMF